jgi:hypothetical protein
LSKIGEETLREREVEEGGGLTILAEKYLIPEDAGKVATCTPEVEALVSVEEAEGCCLPGCSCCT